MRTGRWLTWPVFVELTEIFTAPLNLAWFLLGAAMADYWYGAGNLTNLLLCLLDILIFDLAVNMSDNYCDYTHAWDREGYAAHTNPIGRLGLPLDGVRRVTIILYVFSTIPGLLLVARAGWPVLFLGLVGYALGIFYTAGRFPLNATPLCELVVAVSITYMVPLAALMVSIYGQASLGWFAVSRSFMVCMPLMLIFFAIQLANNIADLDEDIKNHRYTLAYYLGSPWSIRLMRTLIALGALWPLVNIALGIGPWQTVFSPLALPLIWRYAKPFFARPSKQKTYMAVIKGASFFFVAYILLFALGVWL
ncbi:1,4-dihydroxy-2-naphthoate prenyltransferase [Bifidobacterium aemilianum]|uniref:1,4-dihydroxy-2-naphthoate prenyltransferase n=1 Tax=Bifidobacterium aemilianum TaxID=2493120 RepID=A0A366K6M7_9BIFI|nr:prenyltransferase [Bifidobacterium aemilianum]RBP97314.1 1,4-dihydroxy-2-naphthoate prenyltransferase [Bifidobacterium aemilianum]